jgi:hypothetical protein
MILALITTIAVNLAAFRIGIDYKHFWYHTCQMNEPFTRWFSRIAEAAPVTWWSVVGAMILCCMGAIIVANWYWRPLAFEFTFFFGWFVFHILKYIEEHSTDNPPHVLFWRKKI